MSFFLIPKQNKFLVQTKFQPHKAIAQDHTHHKLKLWAWDQIHRTSPLETQKTPNNEKQLALESKWASSCYKNAYSTCLFFISKPSVNFNCDFNFIIISWGSMRKNVRDYSVTKSLVSSKVRNIYPTYNFKKKSKVLILLYHLRRFFYKEESKVLKMFIFYPSVLSPHKTPISIETSLHRKTILNLTIGATCFQASNAYCAVGKCRINCARIHQHFGL